MPLIESPKYLRIAVKSPRWASTPTRSPNSPRDLDEDGRLLPRQVEITKCSAHHRRAGSKHAQIVEVPAVRDEVAVGGFAQDRARLRERFLGASGREQHVIFGDDEVGRSPLVAALPA